METKYLKDIYTGLSLLFSHSVFAHILLVNPNQEQHTFFRSFCVMLSDSTICCDCVLNTLLHIN